MHCPHTLLALAGVGFPALAFAAPSPLATPTPAQNAHWKRDLVPSFAAQPRGFTDSRGVVHLPLQRWARPVGRFAKRQKTAQIQFGDYGDIEYGLNVQIGSSNVPLQLDTGSSDLWSATSACQSEACTSAHDSSLFFKPDSSFTNLSIPFFISYGDTTAAYGTVGRDIVTFGDIAIPDSVVAPVYSTNVTLDPYPGLVGVGFPIISQMVAAVFNETLYNEVSNSTTQEKIQDFVQSWQTNGGPASKLASSGNLSSSSFSITLERTDGPESNAGIFTLGGLPSGVDESTLIYTNVTLYNATFLTPTAESLWDFVFDMPLVPAAWNIPIDGVTVNGRMLPNSSLSGAQEAVDQVGVIGLMDSGTSNIVGPSDIVAAIMAAIGVDSASQTVDCDVHFNMSIIVGGKEFPINPFDFVHPAGGAQCSFNMQGKGIPTLTDYSSWIFGDVFMKNVLAHFDYGDLSSFPQSRPARIGLLSTTDVSSADEQYASVYPPGAKTYAPTGTTIAVPTETTSIANPISAGAGISNSGSSTTAGGGTSSGAVGVRAVLSWLVGMAVGTAALTFA